MAGRIRVVRRAHARRSYSRRGRRIPSTRVKRSRPFTVPDKGKRGRTPKSKRWFHAQPGALGGWNKNLTTEKRHEILKRRVQRDGYATVVRRLNALRNVSTDRETDILAEKDMAYLKKRYRGV